MQSEVKSIQGGCTIEKFDKPELNGYQLVYKFDNGYGASVVKHDMSFGGRKGLYEIAVLDNDGDLCYDTDITNDTVGHLRLRDVEQYLAEISML